MAITGHQTSKEVTRYTKGASQKLRAASAFQKLTKAGPDAKSVPLLARHPNGGTVSSHNRWKNIRNSENWQPVGESNPSFQVENLAS